MSRRVERLLGAFPLDIPRLAPPTRRGRRRTLHRSTLDHRTCIAQLVIERLDGTYSERNERGQYPLYNKVAGVVITGNEDGAHSAAETTLFNLTHLGCAIPPNPDTYWVGEAGPGPSYIEVGQDHEYTKRTTRWMAINLVHLAKAIKANPFTEPIPPPDAELEPDSPAAAMQENLLAG